MDLQGSRRGGGRCRVFGDFPLVAEHSGSGGRANQCRGGNLLNSSAFSGWTVTSTNPNFQPEIYSPEVTPVTATTARIEV
jgi:hypothetical protein